MTKPRIICQFSCGAASAVATKIVLAKYANTHEIEIINAFIAEEDDDNRRFLSDCERWFGQQITVLRDTKYGASVDEVWRREQFMVSRYGAPCSTHLKRRLLDAYRRPTDIMVLGFTAEEETRADNFRERHPDLNLLTPLIESKLGKSDCLAMVERAGIELPLMYRQGFSNANCPGCPKGGKGYWNRIRILRPEVFKARMERQESIGPGAYFFKSSKPGEPRIGLKDLDPSAGRHNEPAPSCGFFCETAEAELETKEVEYTNPMIIAPDQQAIVLNPGIKPESVLPYIATAKVLHYQGHDLVVVPHGLDETRVLRNMGIEAPSPIGFYYDWPKLKGLYEPFLHQRETSGFSTLFKRCYVLNSIGCVDSDTEYLTPYGWRPMDEYEGGKVAEYRLDGTVHFVDPIDYVKKPCAEMIRIKTKYGVDQLLSPEHRVLYVASAGGLMVDTAENILQKNENAKMGWCGKFITTFTPQIETEFPLKEAELRVTVAVIADGYFDPKSSVCRVVVRLKKQRKKERLRALLAAAQIEYQETQPEYKSAIGFSIFRFKAPLQGVKEFGEQFWACSLDQLSIIADEVQYWDSSFRKKGLLSFSSFVRSSADFIQYAFSATGRTARMFERVRNRDNRDNRDGREEIEFTVLAREKAVTIGAKGVGRDGIKTKTMWREPSTNGFKYCFMVPSTFLVLRRNGCVFISGNTGKTQSALWAIDYLMQTGAIRKVLVVAPLSTLERVWADAVFESFPHLTCNVLHGTAAKRRKLLDQGADIQVINHDGFEIICDVTRDKKTKRVTGSKLLRDDIDLIIIDELATYRNAQTDRYRVLKKAIEPRHWVWGMTGTPTPEAPTDAWAQCRLITPETVPEFFTQFRNTTMQQLGPYRWVARKEATEVVFKAMQPAIRFNRDDCIDLPPCMTVEREAPLSTEQKHHFDQIMKVLYTEVQGNGIKAVNEGVKMLKLLQACAGAMYAEGLEEKQTLVLDAEPRLKLLEEIIEECGQKVIVFAPFTGVIDVLEKRLAKRWSVGKVYGGTAAGERNRIFGAFQTEAIPHVLVAHPAAMSHGLTLTEASTIVWYAPITSNDVYTQANGRITRPGQKHNQFIVHLSATPFERKLYKRLEEKTKVQGALLEMVEQGQIAA